MFSKIRRYWQAFKWLVDAGDEGLAAVYLAREALYEESFYNIDDIDYLPIKPSLPPTGSRANFFGE